jgi:putative transposase
MRSKAEKGTKKQVVVTGSAPALERICQLLLPMVSGMAAAKQDLMEWVQEVGLAALEEVFESDAEALTGPKGKHQRERTHHRWGSTGTQLPFGGRRIRVSRPRVRSRSGQDPPCQ